MQTKTDDQRAAELRRRMARPSTSDEEREQRLLDLMELVALTHKHDRHTEAKLMAQWLRNRPDEWFHWIDRSTDDTLAWDALKLLIKDLLDTEPGEYVLSPLALWAGAVACGQLDRPTPKGQDPYENVMRNIAVGVTIEEIAAIGIRTATTTKRDGESACHLVASRLPRCGYEGVKSIRRADLRSRNQLPGGYGLRGENTRQVSSQ